MNTTETLETMTIHLLLGNQGLPWRRYADNARHRRCNSRLVLTRMDLGLFHETLTVEQRVCETLSVHDLSICCGANIESMRVDEHLASMNICRV